MYRGRCAAERRRAPEARDNARAAERRPSQISFRAAATACLSNEVHKRSHTIGVFVARKLPWEPTMGKSAIHLTDCGLVVQRMMSGGGRRQDGSSYLRWAIGVQPIMFKRTIRLRLPQIPIIIRSCIDFIRYGRSILNIKKVRHITANMTDLLRL